MNTRRKLHSNLSIKKDTLRQLIFLLKQFLKKEMNISIVENVLKDSGLPETNFMVPTRDRLSPQQNFSKNIIATLL